MDRSATQYQPDRESSAPDAAVLLGRFVDGGRSEEAFEELVRVLGGVVFSSALRRTGDAPLAEEVAQNVFAILARKAASVRKHAAPMAWIFQTTKHEAAKAMRAEHRRNRKHDALARLPDDRLNATGPAEENEPWRDALPHLDDSLDQLAPRDREIVLQRFVHGRKFREIAKSTGHSEAACKMRVRRALDKLAKLLTSKGVALSTTAVASLLSAEMAKAAPITLTAAAGKILTGCDSLTTATIITNTLQTMSAAKTASLAAAAALVLSAGPALWQHSQATGLQGDIGRLTTERDSLTRTSSLSRPSALQGRGAGGHAPRTVREMLAEAEADLDPEAFMDELLDASSSEDIVEMLRIFVSLSRMDQAQIEKMMLAIKDLPAPTQSKARALQMLAEFAPENDARKSLEHGLEMGVQPHRLGHSLQKWAEEDPAAALAWFRKNQKEGKLAGKSLHRNPEKDLFAYLLGGISKRNPEQAMALFAESSKESRMESGFRIADALAEHGTGSEYRTRLITLLESVEEDIVRMQILQSGLRQIQSRESTEEAVNWMNGLEVEPRMRGSSLAQLASIMGRTDKLSISDQGAWLLAQTDDDSREAAIESFVAQLTYNGQPVGEWISAQPAGEVRDTAWAAQASTLSQRRNVGRAIEAAKRIGSEESRERALQSVASVANHYDGVAARLAFEQAGLSPDDFGLPENGGGSPPVIPPITPADESNPAIEPAQTPDTETP